MSVLERVTSTDPVATATLERIYVEGLTEAEQDDLDLLWRQLRRKAFRNRLRAAYYDGKNAVRDLGISTPPGLRRLPIVLGWSAKAVDLLNRRCRLESFDLPGMDADSEGLTDWWEGNRLVTESRHAGLSSLIHSTAFIVTTQGDVGAGEPEVLTTAKSALSATGTWSRRRRAIDTFLSIVDVDDDGHPTEMALYLDGLNVIMSRTPPAKQWTVVRRAHSYGVPVDPLVYKGDLEHPFGRSRISRAVMSLHNQALRTVLRSEVQAELYSAPQRLLLGGDESAFKNADGTVKSAWQAVLGRVWAIADDEDAENPRADVKEFSAASQQPHVDQLRALSQLFSGETGIPIGSLGLGAAEANPTSEGSYEASREDIVGEAEDTIDGWNPTWQRAALRAMQMLNKWDDDTTPAEFRKVRPEFRNPRHQTRAAAADAGLKTIQAHPWLAETEVGLEIMGLTDDQITRALADRRRAGGTAALQAIRQAVEQSRPVVTSGNGPAGAPTPE